MLSKGGVSLVPELLLSVIANSFWIVGLALLLAAFSYHYYLAEQSGRSLREQLAERSFLLVAWCSVALVGIGLAATSSKTWETLVWSAFTLYAFVSAIRLWRSPVVHMDEDPAIADTEK